MRRYGLTGFVLLFVTATVLQGQQFVNPDRANEEIFVARVKQFGEFVDRFNLTTDFQGNKTDSAFRKKMPREKMLNALFDNSNPGDYLKLREDFIRKITGEKIFIDKHSPGIIAEAKSRIIVNGQLRTIKIFLNQEVSVSGGVKWVMLSVADFTGDMFMTDTSMVRFISPNSNETAFMNLGRALGDKGHLQDYAYNGFKPDNLSIFLYAVNSGIAKFEYAEEVIYHIISIPGWYFKVKDFNRNQLNSGWLISDLKKGNFDNKDLTQ